MEKPNNGDDFLEIFESVVEGICDFVGTRNVKKYSFVCKRKSM